MSNCDSEIVVFQIKLGWTEGALIAGARDVGLSPSIVGSLSRKEASLVEVHFPLFYSSHISLIFTFLLSVIFVIVFLFLVIIGIYWLLDLE